MEYDADRYEARLAGSEHFEETCFRLHWLGYGLQDYLRNQMMVRASGENTGNPIQDFVRHCESLSEYDEKRIMKQIKKAESGWFDTHPSDTDRIESARRENAPGVFRSELPAEVIFQKFDDMCISLMRV